MNRLSFVIEQAEADAMAKQSGQSLLELLQSLVKPAQSLARPPISNYPVAAVGLGSSGRIFIGVNLEFPGLPLHQSVHAEQFLVTNLSLHDEPHLKYVAVSAAPCGHCRQFLQEIRNATQINIIVTDHSSSDHDFDQLSNFLPHPFGPDDLLHKGMPLILESHDNGLRLETPDHDSSDGEICNGDVGGDGGGSESELKRVALEVANRSHAPYSLSPSGVALVDCQGKVYKGSYMESAAYNPSLGPVQAAVVDYVANGGGGGYERIVGAVLVEKENAVVRQEHAARLLLQVIAPRCKLQVFHCRPDK